MNSLLKAKIRNKLRDNMSLLLAVLSLLIVTYKLILRNLSKIKLSNNNNKITILFIGQTHSQHYKSSKKTITEYLISINKEFSCYELCTYPVIDQREMFNIKHYDYIDYCFKFKISIIDWFKALTLEAKFVLLPIINQYNKIKDKINPDFIWIHDLQSGGYLLNNSKINISNAKVILTLYGNDLYFYYEHPKHNAAIKQIINKIDVLHVETRRDEKLARLLGFNGEVLGPVSATLRIYNEEIESEKKQKKIFLLVRGSLGYENRTELFGLLNEIINNVDKLAAQKIHVYCATNDEIFHLTKMAYKYNLDITCCGKVVHSDLIHYMSESKYHVTSTYSDGVANTCVESVLHDCVPIITIHNGFCELIHNDYLNLLVYDLDFKCLISNISKIELCDKIAIDDIIVQLKKSVQTYFLEKNTSTLLNKIFNK